MTWMVQEKNVHTANKERVKKDFICRSNEDPNK